MSCTSIIVPFYNEEKLIGRCIESVLSQTLSDFELILVDDGSIDRSANICENYAKQDNRIKVIHQENYGAISARMCGIENSTGDYVTFLDADDWVEKDFYEKLLRPFEEDDSIDISVSAIVDDTKFGTKSRFEDFKEGLLEKSDAILKMYQAKYFDWSGCGKIYKKSLALKEMETWWYKESLGEDFEWNWKLFHNANNIYFVSAKGYHYYDNVNSMTHKKIDMTNLVLLDRIQRTINETSKEEAELKQALWRVLAKKSTERLAKMICYDNGKNVEIEKCRNYLLMIPEEIKATLPESVYKRVELFSLDMPEVFHLKDKNDREIKESYEKLITNGAKEIFIYGAGAIGNYIGYLLDKERLAHKGFVVSGESKKDILSINEFEATGKEIGFLLALNSSNKIQVEQLLKEKGFANYQDVGKYTFYF